MFSFGQCFKMSHNNIDFERNFVIVCLFVCYCLFVCLFVLNIIDAVLSCVVVFISILLFFVSIVSLKEATSRDN